MTRQPVRERILDALVAGMKHCDSISIYADTSEAYVRQVCNKMADEGLIKKEYGRAHNSYYLI